MDNKNVDAFTNHILNNIDFKVLNSLTSEQLSSIKEAIRAGRPQKKHAIDIRGIINLFFATYYFVILIGRDRRLSTEGIEEERREKVALWGNIVFFIFVLSAFLLLIFVGLYFIKIFLGIDLIPGVHMGGIIGL